MLIRFAHYKAGRDGKWLDNAISIWSGIFNWGTGNYSHSETWWQNPNQSNPNLAWEDGEAFTSTTRGHLNGTVIRPAGGVFKHPERWDITEIEVGDVIGLRAIRRARCAAAMNQGYDHPAISSFFWPWRFGSTGKDICSETSKRFAMWCGIVNNDKIESPRRWSRTLTRLGHKTMPLLGIDV